MDPREWKSEFNYSLKAVNSWLNGREEKIQQLYTYPIISFHNTPETIVAQIRVVTFSGDDNYDPTSCHLAIISIVLPSSSSHAQVTLYIPSAFKDAFPHYKRRLYATLKFLLLSGYLSYTLPAHSTIALDLSDGLHPRQEIKPLLASLEKLTGCINLRYLCYCAPRELAETSLVTLIPDPHFLHSYGYSYLKDECQSRSLFIGKRGPTDVFRPSVYWRGSLNGRQRNKFDTDRARICRHFAKDNRYDLKLTSVSSPTALQAKGSLNNWVDSIVGQSEPFSMNIHYRVVLDIDGNTSSWTGLFGKMLLGCTIVKYIGSADYVQWFYCYHGFSECLYSVFTLDELKDCCDHLLGLDNKQYLLLRKAIGTRAMIFSNQVCYFSEALRFGWLFT